MARNPRETNQNTNRTEIVFDEQAFIDSVYNNEYILVIGSGVILDYRQEEFRHSQGDINRYILSEINNDCREVQKDFHEYQNFTDVFRGTPRDQPDPIYSLLTNGFTYALSDISPELTALLRTKLFKFVLTTTIDGYVETLMRELWGDELRIVNIYDNQSQTDFKNALQASRENKYMQPTLFYVFGKVTPGRPVPRGYVETDVDAIMVIEKWMTDIDPKYIVPFLKEKRILALGCKFDDWYFRFFWYILTRRISDNGYDPMGSCGNALTYDNLATVFESQNPYDQQLKSYLQRRGVCMHNDVWSFMKRIHMLLTSTAPENPFRAMILSKRRLGGIFISYKSGDLLFASELFCKLTREGRLNVWFDNISLYGGNEYEKEIRAAIRQAKIFIPVLSPDIARELESQGERIDTFYSKEWRWAAENSDLQVLPVAIDGYDLHSKIHQVFESLVGRKASGIDMSLLPIDPKNPGKVGYAKLLESITHHLELTEA